jgi:hypothetical protein
LIQLQQPGKHCQNSCVDAAGYSNVSSQQTRVFFILYNHWKVRFKIWGDRSPKGNWRIPASALGPVTSSWLDGGRRVDATQNWL